jgi:sugar phosphate isomerase/epimerase
VASAIFLAMKNFGISTRIYQSEPLTVDVLERLRKAKFHRIEIFANRPHFEYRDRHLVRSVGRWFEENEAPPPSLHLPFKEPYSRDRAADLPLFAPEERLRRQAMDELKRCMEVAEFTPLDYVVLHLGYVHQAFNPVLFEYAYAAIAAVQRLSGAKVLIENLMNEMSTPEKIVEFISAAQLQGVGICFDTGHHGLQDAAAAPFDRIDSIQVSDNDGRSDLHDWPFSGRMNWPAFVEQLTLAQFKGTLLFEVDGGSISRSAEVGDRLNEMFFQADNSIEEFRLRHKLKTSQNPDNEESE